MIVAQKTNPFEVFTDRIAVGDGHLVIDHYADGEIVLGTLAGNDVAYPLRSGQVHALQILIERRAEVVEHEQLIKPGTSPHTLRKDLKRLRSMLEDLDAEVKLVKGSGYRLRDALSSEPRAAIIGDIRLDEPGRAISRLGRSLKIGGIEAKILQVMSDGRARTASVMYADVWGGKPHDVEALVSVRISRLRSALGQIESGMAIRTWTVRTWGRTSACAYFLQMPEPALVSAWPMTRTKSPQLTLGLCVEPRQMTIFDETAITPPLRRSRVLRRAKDRNVPDSWLPLPF